MTFKKLLIANRGEISVRVIRACRELNIKTVAVYSEADARAMHVRLADEAYPIGPAPAPKSYLNIERLARAIEDSGAEAVHPGYGFLAESAPFARAVEAAGVVWVGPSPEAMEAMGVKVRAKELARRAGVPTVPGYDGEDQSEERLAEEAGRIGYPVLVKASAGGGGRGMREVRRPEDLPEAVRGAKREAASAFGDGTVFLEKLVERPRHIEVQIIGDRGGDVIHLFERECSIQRRHQKVVEEAPSPALEDALRERICSAAVRLAKEAAYHNAGTVEFLLERGEAGEEFYFLEMNARLQVEHPVTELVTGLDLVHLQLAVAAGERLPVSQEEVTLHGSAIEVRVYSEGEGGLPAGGRLLAFGVPEGPGIRNDSGVESGDMVSLDYDPMLSKLIVHAPTRPAAVRRLRAALDDFVVLGVPTNLPLLKRVAKSEAFAAAHTTTGFLEEHGLLEAPKSPPVPEDAVILAAACYAGATRTRTADPFDAGPWRALGEASLTFLAGGEARRVALTRTLTRRGSLFEVRLEAGEHTAEVLSRRGGEVHALLDGRPFREAAAVERDEVRVTLNGEAYVLPLAAPPGLDDVGGAESSGAGLIAPMPGTVVKVMVEEGEEVEEGRLLLVLEAMKMEQPVTAPHAGLVESLPYGEGEMVPGGAVLVEIRETEE